MHSQKQSGGQFIPEPLENRRLFSAAVEAVALPLPAIIAEQNFQQAVASVDGLPTGTASPIATIRWGDGHNNTVATTTGSETGEFVAAGSHTYRRAGHYAATVVFRETHRLLARVHEPIIVLKSGTSITNYFDSGTSDFYGRVISVATGARFQGVLGAISFARPPSASASGEFQVRIDWGDGLISPGTLDALANNQFEITGAHVYANPGTYEINAAASYDSYPLFSIPGVPSPEFAEIAGAHATLHATAYVAGAPVVIPPPAVQISGVDLPTAYNDQFSGILATLRGITPDAFSNEVYATIDWGDSGGQSGPFGIYVQYQDGQYVATGFHQFYGLANNMTTSVSGTYHLKITFKLNDHADGLQNTTLGMLDETLTVVAAPSGA